MRACPLLVAVSLLGCKSEPKPAPPTAMPETATPDKAPPDKALPDKASPDKASPDKASPDKASPDKASADLARTVVGEFKGSLKQALMTAIKDKGPAGAIDVCAVEAPRLAAAGSTGPIAIGRATTRQRNPANVAKGWQADAIAHFEAMAPDQRAAAVFTAQLPDGTLAYAEPLIIADMCVLCHGKELPGDVTAALAARYPTDQATGYAVGDLRGVAWAEVRTGQRK